MPGNDGNPVKIQYEVLMRLTKKDLSGELMRLFLVSRGVAVENIVEEEAGHQRKMSVFFQREALARHLLTALRSMKLKRVSLSLRVHRKSDWETRWKKGWKPFALTSRLYVMPLFLTGVKCPPGKVPLYLDTTAAFGTGLHETTRFSAGLIERLQHQFESFLDIGTGTGILGVVAFRSGARYVAAIDIDVDAVAAARQNLKANGLTCDVLKVSDVARYVPSRAFNLVAANLITHDLLKFRQKIISCVVPGGHLVISGISLKNMPLIKKEYSVSAGVKCLKICKGKEWSAFLFKRSSESGM